MRALRCAAPQVRREVGASLTAPITPALKKTKAEESTGGLGASPPLPPAFFAARSGRPDKGRQHPDKGAGARHV